MRKLLLSFTAVMFFAFATDVGRASAQELPDAELRTLGDALLDGMGMPRFFRHVVYPVGDSREEYPGGATREQMEECLLDISDAIHPLNVELEEKISLSTISHDQLGELAEAMTAQLPKTNEAVWKVMKETLPAKTVEQIEIQAFQHSGGIFGGALAIENLSPLDLTAEQREAVEKIVEERNRERIELFLGISGPSPKFAAAEEVREILEKVISLTRDGQREVELLLTDEQKQRAEELMADVPERIRVLSDYLKEHR